MIDSALYLPLIRSIRSVVVLAAARSACGRPGSCVSLGAADMRWLDRYLIRLDSLMVKPSEPLALTSSSNSFAMLVLRVVWN